MMNVWQGEDLAGKSIYVTTEQGLGDEILFAGLLDDLLAREPSEVVWEADRRLLPVLRRSFPTVVFVMRGPKPWAHADFQCMAGSLGRFLRRGLSDFPPQRPPYLKVDEAYAATLRAGIPGPGLPVGISWVSANKQVGKNKTIGLDQWEPVLGISRTNITFVDLQYGETAAERAGRDIHHVEGLDLTGDMDGLAALIWACEAVVTVSNTVAHLAGALGVPVHVLVPSNVGRFWYWGYQGERSIWYPSARVARQVGNDWGVAIRDVAGRLGL